MTVQELFRLGKGSPAAQECIPLNFDHTVPRLLWEDGWVAEFWYYTKSVSDSALYEPQYYLALGLPGGHPVRMSQMQGSAACLGPAPELARPEFYRTQNRYLEACAALLETSPPDPAELDRLDDQWFDAQPVLLGDWLRAHGVGTASADTGANAISADADTDAASGSQHPDAVRRAGAAAPPQDLADYWKQEMARAIQAGDTSKARLAQMELQKTVQKGR